MVRRPQLLPWKTAGRLTERQASGDDVVRQTGWVFNNETGSDLTLEQFVLTGDHEVGAYLSVFGLSGPQPGRRRLVEIGCGIGRMTCALTREFDEVVACDLDAGFLERCREAVARFGRVDRLRTVQVADGRTLDVATDSTDVAFSYITLQHCNRDDALALVEEAIRVVSPGGRIALNFRTWRASDALLVPLGSVVRGLFRVPRFGEWLSRRRFATRLGWQANRLRPEEVIGPVVTSLTDIEVWRNPANTSSTPGAKVHTFEGVNSSHWWLIATVA